MIYNILYYNKFPILIEYFQLSKVLAASKKLQQLIFGDISTTTEIQFNATYSPDIGHIHIGQNDEKNKKIKKIKGNFSVSKFRKR